MRTSRAAGVLAALGSLVTVGFPAVPSPLTPLVGATAAWGAGAGAYDVVVIGASSAGVGAAIGAAREGARVLLTEPTGRVGGMLTNGVTTDMLRQDASSGLFDEHRRLVRDAYLGHPDAALSSNGFNASPDVALEALRTLLDHPGIEVRTGVRLVEATTVGPVVTGVTLADASGTSTVRAATFIDGTPTGDLLGAVGLEGRDWVVGREGRAQYGESLAPERGDRLQQAYSYRLTVQVGGRIDYEVPSTYAEDRARYASIVRTVPGDRACTFMRPDGTRARYVGMRIQRCLPDQKMDINADLLGMNHGYPTAGEGDRAAVETRLAGFALGYLHWLRTEAGMPELGLPRDDYVDKDGFPSVLYVREGRRAVGRATFTQRDAAHDSASPSTHPRSVAIGEYGLDSHCVGPAGGVSGGPACEGGFWHGARPYSIPFDVMVPRRFDNLLVPAAVSASHVGYSTLRMEPVRMNIGYAAGIAAAMATRTGGHAADVDVAALQRNLVRRDQALVYLPGLPTSGPDFVAAQLAAVRPAPPPGPAAPTPSPTPPAPYPAPAPRAPWPRSSMIGIAATRTGGGGWVAAADGSVATFGSAPFHGSAGGTPLNAPVVGVAPTSSGAGYWLLGRDGGVFSYGDAAFHGSTGDLRLNQPIVSLASDPGGRGYWFVAADGGIFSFGAPFAGSAGDLDLAQPVVGMAPTPAGDGYWLVAQDGGIFSYGGAAFSGSAGDIRLNQPIVGMAADPDGVGYWFVAADGGIFSFDAAFAGSAVGMVDSHDRVVGMTPHSGGGYFVLTAGGGLLGFGAASEVAAAPG